MRGDKGQGPKGFTMGFIQNCWQVVEAGIMAFFKKFHESCKFEKSLNASFIALFHKKEKRKCYNY